MTPRMVLEGIYTPLITPFHADGSFDLVIVDNTSAPAIPTQGVMEVLA